MEVDAYRFATYYSKGYQKTDDIDETNVIPKMSMDGLGDYSRSGGFVGGDADLTWQTHTFSQDRGRAFQVDNMDNEETAGVAFGKLAGEFIRTKVSPRHLGVSVVIH